MFRRLAPILWVFLVSCVAVPLSIHAQQTLGGITGQVTDISGAAGCRSFGHRNGRADGPRSYGNNQRGKASTRWSISPSLTYTISVVNQDTSPQKFPGILVQADRTATVNALSEVGQVQSVAPSKPPVAHTVDTTNGYVLDKAQIDTIPLPTAASLASPSSRRRERRTSPWFRIQQRPRQRTHLGQWSA